MMRQVPIDDPHLVFVPFEEASTPPSGIIEHLKDMWWIVHPQKGIAYWRHGGPSSKHLSPWCNKSEEITRRIFASFPWADVKFIPSVFRRINPRDYA